MGNPSAAPSRLADHREVLAGRLPGPVWDLHRTTTLTGTPTVADIGRPAVRP